MGFVWIPEPIAIILCTEHCIFGLTDVNCVYSAVRKESFSMIGVRHSHHGVKTALSIRYLQFKVDMNMI